MPPRDTTKPRIRAAVREWVRVAEPPDPIGIDVPGASEDEVRNLAILGGLATAFGGLGVASWPSQLERWATRAPRPPQTVVELFMEALDAGEDPFAEAYNASISRANRRRLGTVFTPDVVVEHMLDLVSLQLGGAEPATVIDPGAGVGAFTLAAARRWPTARIVAIDINVVTLGLLGARLVHENTGTLATRTGSIELVLADYLDQLPEMFAAEDPGAIVVVGNPPYTRTQAMTKAYKARAAELGAGKITTGHANLATIFKTLTLAALRRQDISCMVVPGSIMYTRAARDLRRALFASERPILVHRWPATARAFIGTNVQAAVILAGPEARAGSAGPVELARADFTSEGTSVQVSEHWKLDRDEPEPENWYHRDEESGPTSGLVPFTQIAKARRGLATGANSFFFLTDDAASDFPSSNLTAAVPSLRRFAADTMTAATHATWGGEHQARWLLTLAPDVELTGRLKQYIADHEDEVKGRHLSGQRKVWYAITDLPRPQILLSPLAQRVFKVVRNAVGAVPSNNLVGIDVIDGDPDALAAWLRSPAGQAELLRVSRRYQGGSHKIEPGDLRRLLVPEDVTRATRS